MRTVLFGGALLTAAAATAVAIGAQQRPMHHPVPHQICAGVNAPGEADDAAGNHAAFLTAKLDLTTAQRATVERVSTEACAAMAKYHQELLGVLTAEQRATLHQLHQDDSGIHAWFRKLHGGR